MAYGTPSGPDDIEAYYTHIRRGRPPTPEQLADLTARYEALGGTSTMARRTAAQVEGRTTALARRSPGRFRVALGQKQAAPYSEDAATGLDGDGSTTVVGLVLAPHFSGASVGEYQQRLAAAVVAAGGARTVAVERWADEPAWLDFTATAVADGLDGLPARTLVLFTAHSLPERVLVDDPYPDELAASALDIAGRAGLSQDRWGLAWQSAGRTPEPWRGPDVLDVLDEVAAAGSVDGVLVCPQGFVTDHLEIGYDLDIEARRRAESLGLSFSRTRTVDDDPRVMDALAERVVAAAGG